MNCGRWKQILYYFEIDTDDKPFPNDIYMHDKTNSWRISVHYFSSTDLRVTFTDTAYSYPQWQIQLVLKKKIQKWFILAVSKYIGIAQEAPLIF